ncbi:MAG: MetQ/NlpA family ABC transporter substrate-binding protein [Cellulomonadaceae bacterium]
MRIRTATRTALAAAGVLLLTLTACGSDDVSDDSAEVQTIRVGALPVPAGELLTWVDENLAADAGLDIEFVEFTDYQTPNVALEEGSIDANLFQHQPFLDNFIAETGADLVSLGEVYLPLSAFYSDRYDSIEDVPDGATIAVPDDPTNEGRALEILAAAGLIEVSENPTLLTDITANPHDFQFVEIENASLPAALPDVDAAYVTIAFSLTAGLKLEDAILVESAESRYYNVLATTAAKKDDPAVLTLYEVLTSDAAKQYMLDNYDDQMLPVQ